MAGAWQLGQDHLLKVLKYAVLGTVAMITALAWLLIIFPLLIAGVALLPGPTVWIAAIVAAAGTVGAIARMLRKILVSVAPMLGGVAFLLLLLIAAAALAKAVWFDLPVATSLTWLALTSAVVVLTRVLASPELWSMFAFYRTHYRIPALSFTLSPDAVTMYVPIDDQGQTELGEQRRGWSSCGDRCPPRS